MKERKIFLKSAIEPLYDNRGQRTRERWVEISIGDQKIHYEFGNERGGLHHKEFPLTDDGLVRAEEEYDNISKLYDMRQDTRKELREENEKLTVQQLINALMETGDYLHPDMDAFLEYWKGELSYIATFSYRYKNVYKDVNGFLAKVTIRRKKVKGIVWIEGNLDGSLVKKVEK